MSCDDCRIEFGSAAELMDHIRDVHTERPEHAACRQRTDEETRAINVRYRENGGPWSHSTVTAYVYEGGRV